MMDSTVNAGMCRCCASEGAFKDIKTSYHWMGEEEVYSDMLRECFDIMLNVSEQGDDGGICEVCITQLRNAINFKKQVLHTEEQFQKHLQNKTLFRPNIVKVELQGDEDSDDNLGSGDEGFSGAEFEVPIKTEVDDPKPKKRAAKASATTTRASAKKAKIDAGETSTKRLGCNTETQLETDVSKIMKAKKSPRSAKRIDSQAFKEDSLKVQSPKEIVKTEIDKHLQNIRTILIYSNSTPIKNHTAHGYLCAFCPEYFALPKELKEHTLENHDNDTKKSFMKGSSLFEYVVKLDITGLKCEICNEFMDGLETLMDHLQSLHGQVMHNDIKNHILPFKFKGDTLKCALCPNIYDHFKKLQEHMTVHYRNYICEICHAPFLNKRTYKGHMSRHEEGKFPCKFCRKVFVTHVRKLSHEKNIHTHDSKRHKCPHCNEKFVAYSQRNAHMVKEHGAKLPVFHCLACDKEFGTKDSLTRHTKLVHLLEKKYECKHCDKKFLKKKDFDAHMVKHTGVKPFMCNICLKGFGRKDHFKQHMRVHLEDRRYRCEECGLAFVQKASLTWHIGAKHTKKT